MAYLADRDQYYWDQYRQVTGATFLPDGSDYDTKWAKPKLSDARRYLTRHFSMKTRFQVTIVGYGLVYSSAQSPISAFSFVTDLQSIDNASIVSGLGPGGFTLEAKMSHLSGFILGEDARITGIYFRALD